MKLRYIIILILTAWCLIDIYGFFGVSNSYEMLIGYVFLSIPSVIILLILTYKGRKFDIGWKKKLNNAAIFIAWSSFIIGGLLTIYRLVYYYSSK